MQSMFDSYDEYEDEELETAPIPMPMCGAKLDDTDIELPIDDDNIFLDIDNERDMLDAIEDNDDFVASLDEIANHNDIALINPSTIDKTQRLIWAYLSFASASEWFSVYSAEIGNQNIFLFVYNTQDMYECYVTDMINGDISEPTYVDDKALFCTFLTADDSDIFEMVYYNGSQWAWYIMRNIEEN